MNDFLSHLFSDSSLLSVGVGLAFIGAVVWTLPLRFKQTLAMREANAARLRAAGEEERAKKIEAGNQRFAGRAPVYGRALVAVGILVTILGALRLD